MWNGSTMNHNIPGTYSRSGIPNLTWNKYAFTCTGQPKRSADLTGPKPAHRCFKTWTCWSWWALAVSKQANQRYKDMIHFWWSMAVFVYTIRTQKKSWPGAFNTNLASSKENQFQLGKLFWSKASQKIRLQWSEDFKKVEGGNWPVSCPDM